MTSRGAVAMARTGRRTAFRRKVDGPAYAAAKAVQRAKPINTAGAQAVARRAVRNAIRTNMDHKWFPFSQNWQSIFDDGNTTCFSLCDIPTGTTDGTRIGDGLQLTEFVFRSTIVNATIDCFARVVLFQWHEKNAGSTPLLANLLYQGTVPGPASVVNWSHNKDSLDMGQMRVLADWRFPLRTNVSSDYNPRVLFFRTKKMRKSVRYDGGTTNGTNKIYLWFGSDVPAASATAAKPLIKVQSEVHYHDS